MLSRLKLFSAVVSTHPNFMDQACSCFYCGFKECYNFSYEQISGASRKLPPGWEEKGEKLWGMLLICRYLKFKLAFGFLMLMMIYLLILTMSDWIVIFQGIIIVLQKIMGIYIWKRAIYFPVIMFEEWHKNYSNNHIQRYPPNWMIKRKLCFSWT